MLEAEELLARQQLSSKLSEEQWRRREELMEEEEDKNKGKLNPLVKAFLLERIRSKQRE